MGVIRYLENVATLKRNGFHREGLFDWANEKNTFSREFLSTSKELKDSNANGDWRNQNTYYEGEYHGR